MSEEDFQKHIEAVATTRLEKPKKMSKQHAYFWREINTLQFHFDRGDYF